MLQQPSFKTGEPLRLTDDFLNSLLAAVNKIERLTSGKHGTDRFTPNDRNIISVKNVTGDPRDRFAVLAFDDSAFDPTEAEQQITERPVLEGRLAAANADIGHWCILLEPLANNAIGPALIAGRVTIPNLQVKAAWHQYAEISDDSADDEWRLVSSDYGSAKILWKQGAVDTDEGLGDKMAVIDIGKTFYTRMFTLRDALTIGGEATAYVERYNSGWTPTTKQFEVCDPHGMFEGDGESTEDAADGATGQAEFNMVSKRWETVQLECPAE